MQARLLPSILSALWTMAQLQYDPGEELMQAGARVLAAEASTMAPQVSGAGLIADSRRPVGCQALSASSPCSVSSQPKSVSMLSRWLLLMAAPEQTTQGLPDTTTALLQALAQALAPFVKLNFSPGTAATDNVAAAAQSQLAELDLPTTIQLLWSLASLQALPSKVWNAVMGRIVDLLTPFADMAGK